MNNTNQEDNDMDRRSSSVIERHFATIASTLILVAVLWVGDTLVTQGNAQIKMAGTIDLMNSELTHLKEIIKTASAGTYTRSNAEADKTRYNLLMDNLARRVTNLEDNNKRRYIQDNKGAP